MSPAAKTGCDECGSLTKHRRYCSKSTYVPSLQKDAPMMNQRAVNLNHFSIKEVEQLIGQTAIGVHVENGRVVCLFAFESGAETRVHLHART